MFSCASDLRTSEPGDISGDLWSAPGCGRPVYAVSVLLQHTLAWGTVTSVGIISISLSPFIGWTRPPISDGGLVTLLNLLYNCGLEHSFSLESNCST